MINVLFSGNEKVFDGVLTCLLSIYKRTETKEPIRAFILTMDISRIKETYVPISDAQIEFLSKIAKGYNKDNEIIKIDVGRIYEKEFAYCPNEMAYCSPYTLLRLFIDLIDIIPDKILYLDVDIMFNQDIRKLYDIDIEDYEYAAARDHYGKYLLNPNYINAGVLLFNMKKAKETKLFEKARHLIKTKKFLFADQSALYKATTKKKMLRQRYNDQKFLHKWTIVRHFSKRLFYLPYPHTDNIKQWHVDKIHKVFKYHQFDDILNEYLKLKDDFSKIKEKNKMKNQKIVPIFFSCDDNYVPFLSVALTSIIKNASKEYFYHFYILHSDTISKLNQERISASHIKENVKIEFVDITDYVVKISEKLHTRDYYSKSTYYRLFIPNLYPQYDKVLYLDSDIVVCGDISKLFNIELGNNLVGAITDGAVSQVKPFQDYVEKRVGVAHHSKYFNAGILLMNNRRLREIDFEELFINLLARVTFTVAQDQDYLNAICRDKVTYIDNSWNQMPINYQDYGKGTPNLVHYNLSFKPWHIDGVAYADLFWKYAKKCTYYKDILTIKENYSPELQMMSEKETEELIKKAIRESLELEKNFIIDSEIKSVHARMK